MPKRYFQFQCMRESAPSDQVIGLIEKPPLPPVFPSGGEMSANQRNADAHSSGLHQVIGLMGAGKARLSENLPTYSRVSSIQYKKNINILGKPSFVKLKIFL